MRHKITKRETRKRKSHPFHVWFEPALMRKVKALARKDGVSAGYLVRQGTTQLVDERSDNDQKSNHPPVDAPAVEHGVRLPKEVA